MAARASWKGFLKVGELVCHVGLYAAASTSDRVSFHTINRATGHRVKRLFVDGETGKPVPSEDQVKGYEVGKDDYVVLEPDEVNALIPSSGDKTLAVEGFVPFDAIDPLYLDRPYYLAPADKVADTAFVLIREGLKKEKSAALAKAVLFRRLRTLLIRPLGNGLAANTLHFDYQIRSADTAFDDIPEMTIKGEMLDLAKHIIETKAGTFDPKAFDDRYDAALAEMVKAKIEGRPIEKAKPAAPEKVIDLMAALRQSAGQKKAAAKGKKKTAASSRGNPAARRKAG